MLKKIVFFLPMAFLLSDQLVWGPTITGRSQARSNENGRVNNKAAPGDPPIRIRSKPRPSRSNNLAPPSTSRALSGVTGEGEEDEAPVIRQGACSQVPYGQPTSANLKIRENDLKQLPLNELMIQLNKPAFVSSPNPDGVTVVDIGMYVYGISNIDPAENTYFLEGFLDLVWCDPRLRFNATEAEKDTHIFLEQDAAKELELIWWPTLFFVNEVNPRRLENEELIISADGTVEYREKFGVDLVSNYDMRKFPFDNQVLVAEIESFAWSSQVLRFELEEDLVGFSDDFDIPEFKITGIREHLEEKMEPRDRYAFSELVVELYVDRDPIYYVTKVIIPLSCIVFISWAVFWMDGAALADRMSVSFTGVLTSVAYQFIVADALPAHIYNTFLDNFVLFSFIIMVLTVAENIAVNWFLSAGHDRDGKLLDRICRIAFPACFATGALILAGAQLADLSSGGLAGILVTVLTSIVIVVICMRHHGETKNNESSEEEEGTEEEDHNEEESPLPQHNEPPVDEDLGVRQSLSC